MLNQLKKIKIFKTIFAVTLMGTISACASGNYPAYAQSQDNIRVVVMGDDYGDMAVSRNSHIYDRVTAALKESMFRQGFQIVDEDMLAVDLGWRLTENRHKTQLIESIKLANGEAKANLYSRALLLFRVIAMKEDLGYANKLNVRVEGELYDLETNGYLGSFELPRITASAPANCSNICISERVGDKAREIAAGLGDILATKLAHLSPSGSNGGGTHATHNDSRCNSMITNYTLEFKRMERRVISDVMNVITNAGSDVAAADSFPCYVNHDMMAGGNNAARYYSYASTAKRAKIYDWLNLILMDLGMEPDRDVVILSNDTSFIIENIIAPVKTKQEVPEGSKFQ